MDSWSAATALIRNAAYNVLNNQEFKDHLDASEDDMHATIGCDYIIFNKHRFSWEEFDQRDKIVLAFLEYFNEEQLQKILVELGRLLDPGEDTKTNQIK